MNQEISKWIDQFDRMYAILFVASLTAYCETNINGENAMTEALDLFEMLVNKRCFRRTSFILILNRADVFRQRIVEHPITNYPQFAKFTGNTTNYEECAKFIGHEFYSPYPHRHFYIHAGNVDDKNWSRTTFDHIHYITQPIVSAPI